MIMWFIKFWIISTIIMVAIIRLYLLGITNELKRKYPNHKSEKAGIIELISRRLPTIAILSIPFFNIIAAFIFLMQRNKILVATEEAEFKETNDET
jgi:lipopolysaccharide export LptBFGC system permease protein LptF